MKRQMQTRWKERRRSSKVRGEASNVVEENDQERRVFP